MVKRYGKQNKLANEEKHQIGENTKSRRRGGARGAEQHSMHMAWVFTMKECSGTHT